MDAHEEIRKAVDKGMACRHQAGFTCWELNCGKAKARPQIITRLQSRFAAREWSWPNVYDDVAAVYAGVWTYHEAEPAEITKIVTAINAELSRGLKLKEPGRTPEAS